MISSDTNNTNCQQNLKKRIETIIHTAQKNPNVVSSWEYKFLTSVNNQVKYRNLTISQINTFEKIEEKFSPAAVLECAAWKADFENNKNGRREIWSLVTDYYRRSGGDYYFTACRNALNPEYIPSIDEYKAVCLNKYAKRVIAAVQDPPKYAVGSLVTVRSNIYSNQKNLRTHLKPNQIVLVIDNNTCKIVTPAKGAKVYKVIAVGKSTPVQIEERFLKKLSCKAKAQL